VLFRSDRYFRAMQRGPDAEEELLDLFAGDAVYVEPFSGGVHTGKEAIRAWLQESWSDRPPGMRLTVQRVDVLDNVVEATWTCESEAFARPARGRDRLTVHNSRITRLETELIEPPEPRD